MLLILGMFYAAMYFPFPFDPEFYMDTIAFGKLAAVLMSLFFFVILVERTRRTAARVETFGDFAATPYIFLYVSGIVENNLPTSIDTFVGLFEILLTVIVFLDFFLFVPGFRGVSRYKPMEVDRWLISLVVAFVVARSL